MIVEAVAVSANTGGTGMSGAKKSPLAKIIEKAMADAVAEAYAAGVTEPSKVSDRMQRARADARVRYDEAVASALGDIENKSNPEG